MRTALLLVLVTKHANSELILILLSMTCIAQVFKPDLDYELSKKLMVGGKICVKF